MSRLIAFAIVCTCFDNLICEQVLHNGSRLFENRHTLLFDKLVKQGYSKMKLKKSFLKCLDKNESLLCKYKEDLRSYINDVVNEY